MKTEEGATHKVMTHQRTANGFFNTSVMLLCELTFNGVIGSKGHLNVIPFQEVAGPSKWLGKHHILIHTKGEGLH